jgi:hypothetical protein
LQSESINGNDSAAETNDLESETRSFLMLIQELSKIDQSVNDEADHAADALCFAELQMQLIQKITRALLIVF